MKATIKPNGVTNVNIYPDHSDVVIGVNAGARSASEAWAHTIVGALNLAENGHPTIERLRELLTEAVETLEHSQPPKDGHTDRLCKRIREHLKTNQPANMRPNH
jgi:hypothetical protein